MSQFITIVTADDDAITVEWKGDVCLLTIVQGHSEPHKMPTFVVELNEEEAQQLSILLWHCPTCYP